MSLRHYRDWRAGGGPLQGNRPFRDNLEEIYWRLANAAEKLIYEVEWMSKELRARKEVPEPEIAVFAHKSIQDIERVARTAARYVRETVNERTSRLGRRKK